MADETKTVEASKPGWKTTEFLCTMFVNVVGTLLAFGVICPMVEGEAPIWCKAIGGIMALLATLGYTYNRTQLKK